MSVVLQQPECEYLSPTHSSYAIIVVDGLFALVDEVFHVVSMSSVSKAFIESLVAYSCILVCWHTGFLLHYRIKSLTVTPRHFAISTRFSKFGCALLVHHLEIVAGSLPNCSASHLLVLFFSARTTFSRFRSLFSIIAYLMFLHMQKYVFLFEIS